MFYETVAGVTFLFSALTILAQLTLLPILFKHTGSMKRDVEEHMKVFRSLADIGKIHLAEKHHELFRKKRSAEFCPPPKAGLPGPPGDPGEDGEKGDDGPVGLPGKSTFEILDEIQQQCIICPQGERGPPGAPGNQGTQGPKGDRGVPGIPGSDGQDGEIGLEGPEGYNGTAGMRGPKGPDGKPATGGVGEPGPKGLPGSIGRTGPQGPRGKRNYVYGPPGPDGKKGVKGMDGLPGNFGPKGSRGPTGEPGADALFCPCPLEMELLGGKNTQRLQLKTMMEGMKKKRKNLHEKYVDEAIVNDVVSSSSSLSSLSSFNNDNDNKQKDKDNSFIVSLSSPEDISQLDEESLPSIIEYNDVTDGAVDDEISDKLNKMISTASFNHSPNEQIEVSSDKKDTLSRNIASSGIEDIKNVQNGDKWDRAESKNLLTSIHNSKTHSTTSDQHNSDRLADLIDNDYDSDDYSFQNNTEQQVPPATESIIHQPQLLSDIANYLTPNRRITIGDTKHGDNNQILRISRDQERSTEDKESSIGLGKDEKQQSTKTTVESPVTGYPDETTGTIRPRFIYVTKRPTLS
uniref:Cuticle collagen sqt-1 n=1 Tax=Setaria digitata TaxID=48799 RepID=A0A915PMA4_9BILA